MPTKQGSLSLLQDPVAQKMLQSKVPARLAYVWNDGTPRVIPIAFHWDGKEIILGSPPDAPKMKALTKNPKVALTIDSDVMPFDVLYIRGTASIRVMDGIVPEYALAVKRYFGEEGGEAWLQQVRPLAPKMARIAIRPEWVGILDFQQRFPSALEKAMERAQGSKA
jgi:general stress protein 26